jgi:5'-nucleotidase
MRILLSNDDGVFAPGIKILYEGLKDYADLTVIAPDRNLSGASNSLTITKPLHLKLLDNGFYSVDGTPTDCVHLGLTGPCFDTKFDMVVSGINDGSNLSDDVLYSGTIAAAFEGRHLGFPAIAVSLCSKNGKHYETAAIIAKNIILQLVANPLPAKTILNVNVPDLPFSELKGIEITRLGSRHPSSSASKTIDPRGREHYWIGEAGDAKDASCGTDFFAIENGYVSVTPLHFDMTHYKIFDTMAHWIKDI